MTAKKKRLTWGVVLMAVLVAAALVVVGLLGKPAVLAQTEETQLPPAGEEMLAGPLADGVDPFVMTFTAYRDTWVDQAHPNANYGGDPELILNTQTNAAAFALLSFNLSALPADAQVVGATLSAYSMDTTSDNYPILPYAATSSWEELVVTWNTRPGTLHLGDLPAKHVPEDWTVFQVTKIVQAWRDGSQPNYGIALRADTGASGSRTYEARKTATPPKLTVYYTRQAELVAVTDTWIGYAEPDTSHGSDSTLSVTSADNALQEAHALLAFDFASLPSDIEVISATLSLYSVLNRQAAGADAVLVADLYANVILESWDEATTTWNNAPAHVALGDPPTSYVLAPDWTEWDVTNIVGAWASGYLAPHGILLRVGPETSYGYSFWSREQANPPRLVIAYGAAPPACKPITSLQVNGATGGLTGVDYTFNLVYYPTDADPPDSIVWTATDHAGQFSGPSVTLSWSTPGEKTIWVEAIHCGGTTSTSHSITISEPPAGCDYPVTGLGLSGPLVVTSGTDHEFLANASPSNATLPFTFIWEATEMPLETMTDVNQRMTNKSYNWPTTGSKTITVTAENCGGSIVAYHGVQVVEPADLPDLRISTAWIDLDQDRIYYIIHNGGSTAVPPGFYVALSVGSSTVAATVHPTPLPAGAVGSGYLDYAWTCGGTTADVAILADPADDVVELDEANNEWSATWACDQKPPVILTGPEVTNITETGARVEWTTDEACYGWVEYDTSPYMPRPNKTQRGTTALTAHAVNLKGLTAGTTYFVRAFCEDAAELRTNSGAVTFESAPPGSDPPVIRSLAVQQYPISLYEFWEVIVELEDASYMDRVSCSLDGTPLGSDYSADATGTYPTYSLYLSPYEMGLTRAEFFGQSHALSCTAYRQHPAAYATQQRNVTFSGDAAPPLRLWIHTVNNDQTIYVSGQTVPPGRELHVTVDAAAYEWSCTSSGWSEGLPPGIEAVTCSNLTPLPVDSITLRIDGSVEDIIISPSELVNTLTADIGGLAVGNHEVQVVALQGARSLEASRTLVVEQGEAGLEVTRSIRREGNTLKVTLDLHNAGPVDATISRVVDRVCRLQPILGYVDQGDVRYEVRVSGVQWYPFNASRDLRLEIYFHFPQPDGNNRLVLAPGESVSVSYTLLPELHDAGQSVVPRIGKGLDPSFHFWQYLEAWVYGPQGLAPLVFDLSATLVNDPAYGMLPLEDAVANAIRQADYVLVTAPQRIYFMLTESFQSGPNAAAEQLFSNMAKLASLESGVLGFLIASSTHPLDDLIEPGGQWAEALNPVFNETDLGYVLIVGETEIVSAWYVGESNFATYAGIPDEVYESDLRYADTRGETARPELVVGRVIGNDLSALNTYLDNIIHAALGEPGYGFHRSKAYVCNGNGDGEWTFQEDGEQVDNQLDKRYDESIWKNFMNDGSEQQKAYHLAYLPDRDLVLYRGHGNEDQWDDGLLASDVVAGVYDLDSSTNPAMLAAACTTGNYEMENDLNLAEVLLAQGAGAYVGATGKSERWANSDAFVAFVPRWQAHESMGQALNQTKRAIWGSDGVFDHRKLWAFQYNLYGDPKYGRVETALAALAGAPEDESLTVTAEPLGLDLKVSLPMLEASDVGGYDSIRIPGGGLLTEPGTYPVPVWTISVDLRPGQRVQDVALVSRSGMVVTGTLNLPVVVPAIDCAHGPDVPALLEGREVTGWYPTMDQVLDWSVEKKTNGGSTLEIVLFPFYYNSDTGDAVYYRTYRLAVETYDTLARIESAEAPSTGKNPGDMVDLDLVLSNGGKPQDLILQASVRTVGTGHVLGGLPLKTLHRVEGTVLASLTWDTRGYTAEDYQLVVELLDTDGHWLDTAVTEVRLGTADAGLTGFTASQEAFAPGDLIELSMTVQNTGTVPLNGTAMFLVQRSEDLAVTQVITAPVSGLAPGASVAVPAVWDTTGTEDYRYRVVGYFKFFSQATEPRDLILYRPRIFLPLVVRNQ